jgi:hypothetical protein
MIELDIHSDEFRRACHRAKVFHNRVSRAGGRAYHVRSGNSGDAYLSKLGKEQGTFDLRLRIERCDQESASPGSE